MALAGGHALVPFAGEWAWEVRTNLATKRTARVLLCPYRGHLVALHGFIKKTRTTPDEDLALARKRQKEPEGVEPVSKKRLGSSIDDFLKEEGIFEEAQAQAVKEVVAWQLAQAMKKKKISKARMAALLKTSRTQVDRLLDPKNDITLSSLQRAAAMVGRRVTIELV
ncbi:MAG: type II toxin-antitoxin system RelE/ParE family toxin [Terriglobia bacterium]